MSTLEPKVVVTLCASKLYLYAIKSCVRRIVSATAYRNPTLVLATDTSPECSAMVSLITKELVPESWRVIHRPVELDIDNAGEKYKTNSQLIIARLQGEAFAEARRQSADICLNVEADVLIPENGLRIAEWALSMPDTGGSAYYDICQLTYHNGMWLGGHGDSLRPIFEDFMPEERTLTEPIKKALAKQRKEEAAWIAKKLQPTKEWIEEAQELYKKIRETCPPQGSLWDVISKHGWRRRGWLDAAYPAIGRGAIVPVDWIGTGAVALSKRALALAEFSGYQGLGTQDLYLCWRKWHPAGLRHCVTTHALCDHIKQDPDGKLNCLQAYHQPDGDMAGHLRMRVEPWLEL